MYISTLKKEGMSNMKKMKMEVDGDVFSGPSSTEIESSVLQAPNTPLPETAALLHGSTLQPKKNRKQCRGSASLRVPQTPYKPRTCTRRSSRKERSTGVTLYNVESFFHNQKLTTVEPDTSDQTSSTRNIRRLFDPSVSPGSSSSASGDDTTEERILGNSMADTSLDDAEVLSPVKFVPRSGDYFTEEFLNLGPIGRGSFGQVFKVKSRTDDGKCYAVKTSRLKGTALQEIQAFARLLQSSVSSPGSQNVVRYFRAWEQDNKIFIMTEFCEHGTLREYVECNDRLSEVEIWDMLIDLALGLKYIHDHGLVHMDLKPENIFLASNGMLKIGDFGISRTIEQMRAEENLEGEGAYMAPEFFDITLTPTSSPSSKDENKIGKNQNNLITPRCLIGQQADIFSLGAILLEIAGHYDLPSRGKDWHRLRHGELADTALTAVGASIELRTLITSALSRVPKLRPNVDQIVAHPQLQAAIEGRRQRGGIPCALSRLKISCPSQIVPPLYPFGFRQSFQSPATPDIEYSNSNDNLLTKGIPEENDECEESSHLGDEDLEDDLPLVPRRLADMFDECS